MIRKESDRPGAGGRRPLLLTFVGNNRQMLNEIRDSLSHLRKNDLEGYNDLCNLKSELCQSSSNLVDKSAGSKMTRRDNQHHKALAEIRDSLRPYQNASNAAVAAGGGGGAGSDSSSSTASSSSSSHAASDVETNSSKVHKIMQYGFDEDIAVRALKLSGNQSVSAALRLLQQIVDEKINGGKKSTGLSAYAFSQRPNFSPSSPAASESNSVRSDSPLHSRGALLVNGLQTPPPLPPRVPMTAACQVNSSSPGGQTPPPGLEVPGAAKPGNSVGQVLPVQSSIMLQTMNQSKSQVPVLSQAALIGQDQFLNQNVGVPQGHVQQMIQRMSPGQAYYHMQQKQQQPASVVNGGVGGLVSQHGVSPVTAVGSQQPVMLAGSSNGSTPAPSPLLSQQLQSMTLGPQGSSIPSASSPASSSNGAQPMSRGYSQAPPPPYSQARLQVTAPPGVNGGTPPSGPKDHLQQQLELTRPSPTLDISMMSVSATRMPMGSSHMPVIMSSVRSKEVAKPLPQTATAPMGPPSQNVTLNGGLPQNYISQVPPHLNNLSALPNPQQLKPQRREVQIVHSLPKHPHAQQIVRNGGGNYTPEQLAAAVAAGQPTVQTPWHRQSPFSPHIQGMRLQSTNIYSPFSPDTALSTPRSDSPVSRATNQSPMSVLSTTSSPSTNSDIPDKPPPPYPGRSGVALGLGQSPPINPPLLPPRVPLKDKPPPPPPPNEQENLVKLLPSHLSANFPQAPSSSSSSPSSSSPGTPLPLTLQHNASNPLQVTDMNLLGAQAGCSPNVPGPQVVSSTPPSETDETDTDTNSGSQGHTASSTKCSSSSAQEKHRCMSPLPERKSEARERDRLRCDTKVRMYSPQAFKFYMEQHVENVLKSHSQRINRRLQLEKEMAKVNLSEEAARQMRKMLHQKESNYIRLKRAKMDSSMFDKLQTLGVGAFGEVSLVRKKDVGSLYAMKTLKKSNVIKRNQVAHVKAERDILAEADNEWVVKLYYSFQDKDYLYFVMDYVPGGDLMGLLIRKEILEENLAQFYIAELVLAIESVHRMGFIHRDIKPDNILIDKDGHIKLTDFGLCTGFRWTHNSKYYQKDCTHARQDSMEVNCQLDDQCRCEILKPLEQRRQREQKRCLAHSLVGTPNYIAPEVLLRQGYTKACDWWSVGVILYEMVIGQPPFYANTPAETQYKVINWKETLSIRHCTNISPAATDLIVQLLQGAETRLGHNGATEVKEHKFFAGINFEGLRRQPAPFKPTIRFLTDTSNFDPVDPDKLRTNDSEGSKKVDSKLENGKHPEHAFFEFTFRRFFDDGGHPCSMPSQQEQESNSPVYV